MKFNPFLIQYAIRLLRPFLPNLRGANPNDFLDTFNFSIWAHNTFVILLWTNSYTVYDGIYNNVESKDE